MSYSPSPGAREGLQGHNGNHKNKPYSYNNIIKDISLIDKHNNFIDCLISGRYLGVTERFCGAYLGGPVWENVGKINGFE